MPAWGGMPLRGLKGKIAAVTGAGSGIGQAVAKRLAEEGCKVAILEWKEAAAADTLKQIRDKGGEAIAYALYVLAANGKAAIGDLRYYAETKLANFATPLAQAQIGAALALYGDKARAANVFKVAVENVRAGYGPTASHREDYGSFLRDQAAVLTLVAESNDSAIDRKALVDEIVSTRDLRRFISTQEQPHLVAQPPRGAGRSALDRGEPCSAASFRFSRGAVAAGI